MATMTQSRSGFGFLGFAAIMVAALLIISMILGTLATSVTMTESTDVAPADMGDEELETALSDAEAALRGAIQRVLDPVGTEIAGKSSMGEVRVRNRVYEDLATEMARRVNMIVTSPQLNVPGFGAAKIAYNHIVKERGRSAELDELMRGPNKRRNCKEGDGRKSYVYKQVGPDTYVLGVLWDDVLVTCYHVTRALKDATFDRDGCPPSINGEHDAMSSPAF